VPEAIPRSVAHWASVHADLPVDGRCARVGIAPARLNRCAPQSANLAGSAGPGHHCPGGDPQSGWCSISFGPRIASSTPAKGILDVWSIRPRLVLFRLAALSPVHAPSHGVLAMSRILPYSALGKPETT